MSDDASSTVRNNLAASISKMGCNISKWIIDSSIIFANNKLNGKEERRKSYGQHYIIEDKEIEEILTYYCENSTGLLRKILKKYIK